MGMYDESWCASCGKGMHYTEDQTAECGECQKDFAIDFIEKVIAYMTNHLAGLEEELTTLSENESANNDYLEGSIEATDHLLHKVKDMYQNA
jgi:hypothetical protein